MPHQHPWQWPQSLALSLHHWRGAVWAQSEVRTERGMCWRKRVRECVYVCLCVCPRACVNEWVGKLVWRNHANYYFGIFPPQEFTLMQRVDRQVGRQLAEVDRQVRQTCRTDKVVAVGGVWYEINCQIMRRPCWRGQAPGVSNWHQNCAKTQLCVRTSGLVCYENQEAKQTWRLDNGNPVSSSQHLGKNKTVGRLSGKKKKGEKKKENNHLSTSWS